MRATQTDTTSPDADVAVAV